LGLPSLYIAGTMRRYSTLKWTDHLILPDDFEAEQLFGDPGAIGDAVEIKDGATLLFKGAITEIDLDDSEDEAKKIRGQDEGSLKLSLEETSEERFIDTEPLDILKVLITPNKEIGAKLFFEDDFDVPVSGYSLSRGDEVRGDGYCLMLDETDTSYAILRRTESAETATNSVVSADILPLSHYSGARDVGNVSVGLALRCTDANNFYMAILCDQGLRINKMVASSETNLATVAFDWQHDAGYKMTFIANGTSLKVVVESNVDLVSLTATDNSLTSGKAGMVNGRGKVKFANFKVLKIGTATAATNSADAWKAIDGDLNSFWQANNNTETQWLKYDLTEIIPSVCRILVRWRHVYDRKARHLKVEVSTDDSAYDVMRDEAYVEAQTLDVTFTARNVRFIKVSCSNGRRLPIAEIRVFQATGDPVITLGKTAKYGQGIDFQVSCDRLDEAIRKLAEFIGWNAWCSTDGNLNFLWEKGTNRTVVIIRSSDADAYVWLNDSTPRGSEEFLYIRPTVLTNYAQRTLIKFPQTKLESLIPSGVTIVKAEICAHGDLQTITGMTIDIHKITSSWDEATVIWSNQPSSNATPSASLSFAVSFDVWEFAGGGTMKDDVADWRANPGNNFGWLLKANPETGAQGFISCVKSKEHARPHWHPYLRVEYIERDQSSTVKFERGLGGVFSTTRRTSGHEITWKARMLGHGEGAGQVCTEVSDSSIKTNYPTLAHKATFTFPDVIDATALASHGRDLLKARSIPAETIEMLVEDEYARGTWGAGDLITILNTPLGVSGARRVQNVEREIAEPIEVAYFEASSPEATRIHVPRTLDMLIDDLQAHAQVKDKISSDAAGRRED